MIIVVIYILAVIMFCVLFYYTRVLDTCRQVLNIVRDSASIMSDDNLGDHAKEKEIKKAALKMVKNNLLLFIKILIILSATMLPIWLADIMKLATIRETSRFAMRWDVLVITTIIVLIPLILLRQKR